MSEEEKCCYNCANLHFGWSYSTWDDCDYTCKIGNEEQGYCYTFILCAHFKTKEQIKQELSEKGLDCHLWKKEKKQDE